MISALTRLALVVTLAEATFTGCGYFSSGAWEDGSDNWSRAFGTRPP